MGQRSEERLDALSPQEKRALLARLHAGQVQRPKTAPLSLAQERLFALCQLDPASLGYNNAHILAFTTHRLVFDGQCWPVLIAELGAYIQATDGAPAALAELPLQYADFAAWQRSWLQGVALEGQLAYWRTQLGGRLPLLQLPIEHDRAAVQVPSDLHSFALAEQVSEALRQLSRQAGVSVFVTLLATFAALLHHTTAQTDFVIFTSVAGRSRPELTGLIGLFANILAWPSCCGPALRRSKAR